MAITGAMIHRGSRFPHLRLPCLAFRLGEPLPLCTERVSASFSTFLGRFASGSRDHGNYITPISCRNYADGPVSRPKAHTGRTTTTLSKKDPTATTTATTITANTNSKGGKNPVAKVKAKPKKKPNPKTKAKTTSRSNAKVEPGRKKRPIKALTAIQKQKLDAKKAKQKEKLQKAKEKGKLAKARKRENLPSTRLAKAKATALHVPKRGGCSVWQLVLFETARSPELGHPRLTDFTEVASARYRGLSPERREHYNRILIEQRADNEAAYQQWVESYTPEQIRSANVARRYLRRKGIVGYTKLADKRQVKGPRRAHNLFNRERQASNEYAGISITDRMKLIQKEWKELPASEKKTFEDMSSQDRQRYVQEVKAVYDRTVLSKASDVPAAAAASQEEIRSAHA